MRPYLVQTADSGDLAARRDAARDGRAAAMSRRRALATGRSAPAHAHQRVRTRLPEAARRVPVVGVHTTLPAAPNGRGTPSAVRGAPGGTPVAINGVAAGRLGRALAIERRRQLSQGKQALMGGSDRTAAAAGAGAPAFVVHRGGVR